MLYAWLYFENRFKGCYLPDAEKWTERVAIWQSESGWDRDYFVTFYCENGRPSVLPPEHFRWEDSDREGELLVAQNGVRSSMRNGDYMLGVVFTGCGKQDSAFKKYLLPENGRVCIGRDQGCELRVRPELDTISKTQGIFEISDDMNCIYTDKGVNGSYLNGIQLSGVGTRLSFGDVITYNTGLKIIYLGSILAVNHLSAFEKISLRLAKPVKSARYPKERKNPSVQVQFHRSPRFRKAPDGQPVSIEAPIERERQQDRPLLLTLGPSATMVLPMVMGTALAGTGGGYMGAGIAMMGTASVLAVFWALLNHNYRKKSAAEQEANRVNKYNLYIDEMDRQLKALYDQEYRRLLETLPSPEQCAMLPQSDRLRLWERMPGHSDFMVIRLGLGDVPLPNEIKIPDQSLSLMDDPLRDEPKRLRDTYRLIGNGPVSVNLREENVIGILGEETGVAVAQSILLQLAALHSYHDVRIAVLTGEGTSSPWRWARWLPHVFNSEDRELRMVVSEPAAVSEVLSHLEETISMRREAKSAEGAGEASETPLPHYVIFCTDPSIVDNKPIMRHMLSGHFGITLVIIAASMELLPKECGVVLDAGSKSGFIYTADGAARHMDFEFPNFQLLQQFSQMLAPLRVKDSAENAAIPTMVPFLELYGVREVEELDIWRNWTRNHVYEGLRSTIGLGAGSRPFVLDISDKAHGPHGLVAGTTGSGKSVMLQTYILSLAVNYHPDQIRFILIDYKGGGMAKAFEHLPHVTGIIDNLQSENTIARALASLQGEIHRREKLFSDAGVDYINDYIRFYYDDPEKERLPHLIIIVDEFAELAADKPDFLRELVSASRVGRSLGVHLILATQKPSNSVSSEIWSNSNFRICLRVQGRNDSTEMLRRPDAAYLKNRGRCYVQVGNDEIYEQVQTSYSGLAYHPDEPSETEFPHLLDNAGQVVRIKRRKSSASIREQTQMDAVLERIIETAKEYDLPPVHELWKKELASAICLLDLPEVPRVPYEEYSPKTEAGLSAVFAMADDVQNQRHIPVYLDFPANRNYLVVGMAASGKTTLLQTVILSMALRYSPETLNMYVLSLTSRTLGSVSALPQIGEIIYEGEEPETRRLMDMLLREHGRRRNLLAAASTDSFLAYNQTQISAGKPMLPAIVVFVDRFSQLNEMLGDDDSQAKLSVLLQEGSSRGIFFMVTAMSIKDVPYKMRGNFRGIALQVNDRGEYVDILGRRLPADMPDIAQVPGRGVAVIDSQVYEIQTALGGRGDSDEERAAFVNSLCATIAEKWNGPLPEHILRIPEDPDWRQFSAAPAYLRAVQDPWQFPLAYDLVSGDILSLRLEESYSLLITGPQRSGKTCFLRLICEQWAARGAEVAVLADTSWSRTCKRLGLALYDPKSEAFAAYMQDLNSTVLARNAELRKHKAEGPQSFDAASKALKPIVLVMDDIARTVPDLKANDVKFLSQLLAGGAKFGIYTYASVSHTDYAKCKLKEPVPTMVHQLRGVALRGKLSDFDPWNLTLPVGQKRRSLPLGQGILINNGEITQIVIPKAEEDGA